MVYHDVIYTKKVKIPWSLVGGRISCRENNEIELDSIVAMYEYGTF